MTHSSLPIPTPRLRPALQGALAILPLCLAVLPWGILAGSMALQSGLTASQGLGMSAIVFAGASQLVAMGMIKGGAGLLAILLSTFFVTAQHFLYALRLRAGIAPLPLRWRLLLGFLLTDELFALTGDHSAARFDRWYALGAGLTFYVCWLLTTWLGIAAAGSIGNLDAYGLDFSIAATFIAIVVPLVRSLPVLACALTALLLSVVLHHYQIPGALIIASVAAMLVGLLCSREAS
ncbi:Inner membrane protein YgaZ [Serratia rubidaea]|uniref:Inner membrane protein YgaZ n=1 Tax=Serratia rubidaea TaxID=61652 RepID=A0A4U9HC42_SERRU|nr:AzlC family ABC transporter permease [Serratia rubidaea]MDC6111726.1 AzlC family ABC transporter permease [Serratia rubidaea]MDK1704208.1 AzlC family ABC transporter permease [Serratia rubidaea]QPR61916.1 AzlC family ABC transporter permease [Serratia rubidaea]CAI0942021.1 Inner membrane protein YgaZ [Serratia rubidaea]CAI1743400.1 Inner membrane protein YgaZ [Serratia rubidaea]